MIAIVDYGIGNIKSLWSLLEGEEVILTHDHEYILKADVLILPGVGAFGYAMEALKERRLISTIKAFAKTGKPLIGICLGMQLFYEFSKEYGDHEGLGLLRGTVIELPDTLVKPHMGWNKLTCKDKPTCKDRLSSKGDYMYFVHSYYVKNPEENTVLATVNYGIEIPAIIKSNNIIGFQGHPEKSGSYGRDLFLKLIQTGEVML